MIAIGLSPNTQRDDIILALKLLCIPWKWKKGEKIGKVENWFKTYLQAHDVVAVNSGRSALYLLLQSFGIEKSDEVIVQAFTCLAVPEVVRWVGAQPVFVDIDESLNIDPSLLEKSITKKTKAIIVQHTFGVPAKIELITKIAQKYNIILIEDCAHSLGATYNGQKIGTFGDAAFFSFGRDKVISSVFGGMAMINEKCPPAGEAGKMKNAKLKLKEVKSTLKYPSIFWIFQQLLHPIAFSIILPSYRIGLGRLLLIILQKLHLISFPIYKEEKAGQKPDIFPQLYPNALAYLLLNQLGKLDKLNKHRKQIADTYFEKLARRKNISLPVKIDGAIYLRFNIITMKTIQLLQSAKRVGILLGNWYHDVIDPEGSKEIVQYQNGCCPKAEELARKSINLPTNISVKEEDIKKMMKII